MAHGTGRQGRAADGAGLGAPRCTQRAFAAVESAADDAEGDSPVARRLLRELAALGYAPDDVGVCLGDGADWLRRLYAEWFPRAVRIVDFFQYAEFPAMPSVVPNPLIPFGSSLAFSA